MKVYLSGTNVVIEGGILVTPATFPAPQSDYTITGPSGSETILIEDLSTGAFYSALWSDLQNQAGATFVDLASVTTYLNDFIGVTGGGTPTAGGVETWSYRNSDYVSSSNRLTLSHNNFSVINISNNVTLLSKTAATSPHDGTKFLFTEGDVIIVKVVLKIDSNVSDNLLMLRLKARDGNFSITQATVDTNVQEFGQVLNCEFSPFIITSTLASGGFDINILDYVSTADSFVYNMKFTILNLGQNV